MGVIYDCGFNGCEGLKPYFDLKNRQLKRDGVFICEGIPAIESALSGGIKPVSMLLERRHAEGKARGLIEKLGDIPIYAPPDEDIKRLTGIELSRGVLCAMERPRIFSAEEALKGAKRVIALEDVRDETNMGSILRSAAALGADAVLITKGSCDPYSRRSVRVSMGAAFRVAIAEIEALGAEGLKTFKSRGFFTAALWLGEDSQALCRLQNEKTVLIFGNEGAGLKPETARLCDVRLKIPMSGGVDSLNVSAAAAVAMYTAWNR